jgi:hypothetical protein
MKDLVTKNSLFIEIIPVSAVLPSEWHTWFYMQLAEENEFVWGCNNHSLVSPQRFFDVSKKILAREDSNAMLVAQFYSLLSYLNQNEILIDLEK